MIYKRFARAAKRFAALRLDWYNGEAFWTWVPSSNVAAEEVLVSKHKAILVHHRSHPPH